MLRLKIPKNEFWDPKSKQFIYTPETELILEHSLVSLTKWEQKHHKPFLSSEKTIDETIDYIRCMMIDENENFDQNVLKSLSPEDIEKIREYMNDPMTATTIKERKKGRIDRTVVTSEIIYYWMTALQIPLEFENRHLNTLLTLIRVCSIKNSPPEKMSKKEIYERNRAINEARKAKLHTKG